MVFSTPEARQRARAPHRVVDLEHHGRDQLLALGNQRIVG